MAVYIPECLDWCKKNYVPKVEMHIFCYEFGKMDGMDGSCHWCHEMTPYQWEMCADETWKKSLMSFNGKTNQEAIDFIQEYKEKNYG